MKHLRWDRILIVLGLVLSLCGDSFARKKKDDEGFPDYNKLEYTQKKPDPDHQVQESAPGSFHMEVGNKRSAQTGVPLDQLPIAVRGGGSAENGEPPIDFIDTGLPVSTVPAVASTTTVKTEPIR